MAPNPSWSLQALILPATISLVWKRYINRAVEILRRCRIGNCGRPGFYGALGKFTPFHYPSWELILAFTDIHVDVENDIVDFLGGEAAILYSPGFSTISSVIPLFWDVIVTARGADFAVQNGFQISRSTVRWLYHDDLNSPEEVLIEGKKEIS